MSVTVNRVWRQLPEETRVAACKIYWAQSPAREKQYLMAILANAKNLREVTVRKTPVDRLVQWTASSQALPDPLLDDLIKEYLLHAHRAVIVSFLELLKIPHTDGMIEERFDMATLNNEQVQAAARSLLDSADRAGAELYLNYLVLQGGPWAGIEEVVGE